MSFAESVLTMAPLAAMAFLIYVVNTQKLPNADERGRDPNAKAPMDANGNRGADRSAAESIDRFLHPNHYVVQDFVTGLIGGIPHKN